MNYIKIVARYRTPCRCGFYVNVGEKILWDPRTRKTMGCVLCKGEGHPDPETIPYGISAEDHHIFHNQ
jgi:hypothetical protein